MEASPTPSIPSARPYRSHKLRACDYCRKRKARCSVEKLGQACLLCRSNGFNCAYSDTQNTTGGQSEISAIGDGERASPVRPLKRTHAAIDESGPNSHVSISQHQTSQTQDASRIQHRTARGTPEQSAHIVGPAISSDAHVLEQYMTPNSPEGHQSTQNPYSVYSTDPHKPVLYRKVPRRRPGLEETREPGVKQKAILDQILAPNTQGLLQLYFEKVHPAFPVVDETKFVESSTNEPPHPSAALTCAIYSITLSYWSQFKFSKNHIRPDAKFAWNLAVKAIQDEFLGPGFSTLQAVLVDLTGRPTFSITGNVINNGKAVTLSHSLGLNRDPSSWNISQHEKSLRVRLWWGVLIHDRWGSFAHGTPPLINSAQYDVPIPTLNGAMISPRVSKAHEMTLECFVALCKLTEILGRVLPLIYDLKGNSQKEILKVIRRVETDIDEWEDALPDYLQKNQEVEMSVSGSSSLYLGLLSLKMLVCRISLHAVGQMDDSSSSETLQYRQFECRKAAQNIVDFVQCLDSSHLGEFWLPYGAYYLTSTTTLLLRFAVETTDDSVAESCVSSVKTLTQRLRQAKDHDDWDLADDSLSQCDGILARITHNARPLRELPVGSFPALEVDAPPGDWLDATLPAFYGPMDGSGQMRDVWNMFDFEPFNI